MVVPYDEKFAEKVDALAIDLKNRYNLTDFDASKTARIILMEKAAEKAREDDVKTQEAKRKHFLDWVFERK